MKVTTPFFRVSYPNVFKPRLNKLNNKEEYNIQCLFPKGTDLTSLKQAAQSAMEKKWGSDQAKWPKNIRTPFRNQGDRAKDGKTPMGYEDGAIYLNLRTDKRPGVVDQNRNPILDENEFYAGCWARATISAYAYDQAGNRGVSFGLLNLQKVKDDEPLGTRVSAEDDFQPVAGAESGQAATGLFD